jgi:hypothetical protein
MYIAIKVSILVEKYAIRYYLVAILAKRFVTYLEHALSMKVSYLNRVVVILAINLSKYVDIDVKRNAILVQNAQIRSVKLKSEYIVNAITDS